jgi:hypothetical protein
MKKIIWALILLIAISLSLIGCKTTTDVKDTTIATDATVATDTTATTVATDAKDASGATSSSKTTTTSESAAPKVETTPTSPKNEVTPTLSGLVDGREDDELPPWNGYNFGPNLEYREEYISEGDPGEYLSTYEAAKLVFTTVKGRGNIPVETDNTAYTILLTGIETIGESNEECYIYMLEIAEPDGMVGAPSYAYAYQSGNLYFQGDDMQWVLVYPEIGGLFSTDRERAEFIIKEVTKNEAQEIAANGGKPDYAYKGDGEIGGGRAWYFDLVGGNTEQYHYAVNEWGELWGMDTFGKWQRL